jgi:hypothetical protein
MIIRVIGSATDRNNFSVVNVFNLNLEHEELNSLLLSIGHSLTFCGRQCEVKPTKLNAQGLSHQYRQYTYRGDDRPYQLNSITLMSQCSQSCFDHNDPAIDYVVQHYFIPAYLNPTRVFSRVTSIHVIGGRAQCVNIYFSDSFINEEILFASIFAIQSDHLATIILNGRMFSIEPTRQVYGGPEHGGYINRHNHDASILNTQQQWSQNRRGQYYIDRLPQGN